MHGGDDSWDGLQEAGSVVPVVNPIAVRQGERQRAAEDIVGALEQEVTRDANSTELQIAINNVQGGDTITLLSNTYNDLTIYGKNNNSFVVIRANTGAAAIFSSINFNNCSYWELMGVEIKPRYTSGADGKNAVNLDGSFLTVKNCDILF